MVGALGIGLVASTAISASPFGPGYGMGGDCPKGEGFGPGSGQGYGMKGGFGPHHGGPGMQQGRFQRGDMVSRLSAIKDELKITTAQEPAWDKFVTTLQKQRDSRLEKMQSRRAGQSLDDVRLSAVERLDKRVGWMNEGLAQMKQVKQELDTLYQVLDADQRELVDRLAFMRHQGRHAF